MNAVVELAGVLNNQDVMCVEILFMTCIINIIF